MAGALTSLPTIHLATLPTAVEALARLRAATGARPRLLVKRDDAIAFAFGGNKVRKLRFVGAEALAMQADTLITAGGVQSNHARVTAAVAARLGMRCILIANGAPADRPTANARLSRLLGADIRYVPTREARAPAMEAAAADVRRAGGRPYVIPIGASTPLGAAAYVDAVSELLDQIQPPDVVVHATSSGGTQAGLVAGFALAGVHTRVIGISADESPALLELDIRRILQGLVPLLGLESGCFDDVAISVDDAFVGEGYGMPSVASQSALTLVARSEGLFLDPTYTAKAMAGLIDYAQRGLFDGAETVLFWHTGGQVGIFA